MNKKLVTAAAIGALFLAGCAKQEPGGDMVEYPEYYVACYKGDKFVKMDDDCYDDGLTVGPRPKHVKVKPSFKPQPTSGGMQTAGPLKTATGTKTSGTTPRRRP